MCDIALVSPLLTMTSVLIVSQSAWATELDKLYLLCLSIYLHSMHLDVCSGLTEVSW